MWREPNVQSTKMDPDPKNAKTRGDERYRLARLCLASLCILSLCFGSLSPIAEAQRDERPWRDIDAATARLNGLTRQERELLKPHLERGPIVFTEFTRGRIRQPPVTIAAYVNAPAHVVAEVIATVDDYPGFMPALDEVSVETRRTLDRSRGYEQLAYSWTWQLAVFTLSGHNVMTIFPPPREESSRPFKIDVRNTGGDLGVGRMMWRVYREGPNRSLMVLSSRLDMAGANYIADQLATGGRAVTRTITIAMSTVMILGTRKESERRVGYEPPMPEQGELEPPTIDANAMAPMLARGDLAMLDMDGDRLNQVNVIARMGHPLEPTRNVMSDPEEFGQSLMSGSRAEVVSRDESGILFEWEIPLPLVGVEGSMRLVPSDDIITVEGVTGGLSNGAWGFNTHEFDWNEVAVMGWGRFDPADSSRLIRRLIAGNVYFSHGLSAGMQIMVARSLRTRVRRQPRPDAETRAAWAAARQVRITERRRAEARERMAERREQQRARQASRVGNAATRVPLSERLRRRAQRREAYQRRLAEQRARREAAHAEEEAERETQNVEPETTEATPPEQPDAEQEATPAAGPRRGAARLRHIRQRGIRPRVRVRVGNTQMTPTRPPEAEGDTN